MALSQIYTAVTGDTITSARWNNEFGNIYGNGTDVAFPLTKNASLAGFTLTLDAASVTSILSSSSQGLAYTPGAKTGTPGANGSHFNQASATFTDSDTAISGTAALWTSFSLRRPTLAATNTGVTTTEATTLYIENAPAAGTNETITNAYAIHVEDGAVQLDGALTVGGTTTLSGAVVVSDMRADTNDPYLLTNLNINATVSGSALTIALKTDANTDASTTDPIRVRFRNATLGTSGTTNVNITAALSFQISTGSTVGTVSGQAHRIYIGLLNNSGTAELFVYNPLSGTNIIGLQESNLITTTAEGGAGGADSAQVTYSTTARTSVPFRIIGFFESTQATAGIWDTSPSKIQELQPWMPRTGHVVQSLIVTQTTATNGTSNIPTDNSIPQSSEGTELFTQAITPTFAGDLLYITPTISMAAIGDDAVGGRASASAVVALFQDSTANALRAMSGTCAVTVYESGNDTLHAVPTTIAFTHRMIAATVSATTFKIRVGASSQATTGNREWEVNGYISSAGAQSQIFNGRMISDMVVQQIMV